MRKLINKKFLTAVLMFLLLYASISVAAEFKNQTYSRLNPAVVQISLSKPDILGKLIDNDFTILEINDNYVIIFSTSE